MTRSFSLPGRLLAIAAFTGLIACRIPAENRVGSTVAVKPAAQQAGVSFWLTRADSSVLLKKQDSRHWGAPAGDVTIAVDPSRSFQSIDGFGFTLTGGSATLINSLGEPEQDALLKELFSSEGNGIGLSYLRISIGASDLNAEPFTYNDLPDGRTDTGLVHFTLEREKADLIPVLKKIVAINPGIRILGSPWSAPRWMKTNNSFIGGSLKKEYYPVYAAYFVRYIREMKKEGITIDAITIQNEPLHPGNNPSMYMEAAEQGTFIRQHLGPAFRRAGIRTKIILYDHNLDKPEYPVSILNDPETRKYVDGSAFHLYAGDIRTLSDVHDAHPDKHVYFTEQWIGGPGNFAEDFRWHMKTLVIGATRNWSRNVLEWNLAADENYQPHTDQGGCTSCLGGLTISGQRVRRNTAYYVLAHVSKFVPPGSVRIASNDVPDLPNVAFRTSGGTIVLVVMNDGKDARNFSVRAGEKAFSAVLDPGSAGTFVW